MIEFIVISIVVVLLIAGCVDAYKEGYEIGRARALAKNAGGVPTSSTLSSDADIKCVYRGAGIIGFPFMCRQGDDIYMGWAPTGFPIFHVYQNSLYRGASGSTPIATLTSDGYVMEGLTGKYVGFITSNSIWLLQEDNKTIVATGEDDMLLMAVLFV